MAFIIYNIYLLELAVASGQCLKEKTLQKQQPASYTLICGGHLLHVKLHWKLLWRFSRRVNSSANNANWEKQTWYSEWPSSNLGHSGVLFLTFDFYNVLQIFALFSVTPWFWQMTFGDAKGLWDGRHTCAKFRKNSTWLSIDFCSFINYGKTFSHFSQWSLDF